MKVEFRNSQLEKLYSTGQSKKYPVGSAIATKFVAVVARLKAAQDIHDLWRLPSLNFERLHGNPNRYSARVTIKYRVEMEIDWENQEKTIGLIGIIELSSHYGGR